MLSCTLLLGVSAGCDVGGSTLYQPSNGTVDTSPGGGGSGGGGSASGGSSTAPGGPCTTSSECTDQVCSPDGHCVDCHEDTDCLVNQYCSEDHCIATGEDTGGTGGGGTGGHGTGGGSATACAGAQLLFVIQRSGTMFEQPDADANYWDMVRDAVAGTDGALSAYWDKLDAGALFFVRVQDDDTCPVVSSAAPKLAAMTSLTDLFTMNESAYQELKDSDSKMDAPVPEAITAAAATLSGSARHLVLITTGVGDTCDDTDDECLMDPAIKAVQDAQKMGVTTHVIGLGNTDLLNTASDKSGYQTYLSQLANAGAGKPVKKSSAFDDNCSDGDAKAQYADGGGDAHAYRAENTGDIKQALDEILKTVCP
jgi:hypothetical protein